ncbi:hypothetical protein Pryu01_02015 [Paraliobacillus ryukyuensis]|uniref:DUF4129 domain-containing protein n=1 Tax=Paraliobacillus ryukyuensis TaxID=200904 RepID=A0A366DYY9_9BACI|nr:hypothetical protein [Paraliobacillus ryukyuensis]RBO95282.1 hypothetical protein DES48_109121 [Paraliobacillus ryukyuensis]
MNNGVFIKRIQWINELILFYLALNPLVYLFEHTHLLRGYLLLLLISIVCFPSARKTSTTYFPIVIIAAMILLIAQFGLNYSIITSLVIAAFFSWRFLVYEIKQELTDHYKLLITSMMVLLISLFVYSSTATLLMGIVQFIILIATPILLSYNKSIKHRLQTVMLFLISLMAGVTGMVYLVYPSLQFIFQKTMQLLVNVGFLSLSTLDRVLNISSLQKQDQGQAPQIAFESPKLLPNQTIPNEATGEEQTNWEFVIYAILISIIVAILVFLLFKWSKRKISVTTNNAYQADVHVQQLDTHDHSMSIITNRRDKPSNIVRRLFYSFEQYCHQHGVGRGRGETVEEWFTRINLPIEDISLYFHIRYNHHVNTPHEVQDFRENLAQLRKEIKQHEK